MAQTAFCGGIELLLRVLGPLACASCLYGGQLLIFHLPRNSMNLPYWLREADMIILPSCRYTPTQFEPVLT